MSEKKVLIFVFMVALSMQNFNCTSIQKKYTPLFFPYRFWHNREFPEKIEKTSYGAKKSGLMAVDIKEPIVRNSNFEGNTRYFCDIGPIISFGNFGTRKFLYQWRSHKCRNLKFSMNHERYIANPP